MQQLYAAALHSLTVAQSPGHLDQIELQLGSASKVVNLKIPVMFIIGDNQGGDTICGRHIHYGRTARRISRMCDAGPMQLSKPEIGSCRRLIMQDIMNLVTTKNYEELFDLYQAQHWIAWFDLDYGGNPEGIFTAACPPEALHALENGIFLHMLRELFDIILKSKSVKGMLDQHVYTWNSYPAQHLMRSHHIKGYPRLLFTSGITTLTNTTANDKVGVIFCIVIASLQLAGKDILLNEGRVSDTQYVDILYVFEMMLCYRAWLQLDKYWMRNDREMFKTAQESIEKLLKSIIKLMPRSTGQNWDICKIHEQLHVAENIEYFGAHQNVHTGPQEHNHIENTKKPSRLVQRNKKSLDLQLAKRLSEKYLIETAFQKFNNVNISDIDMGKNKDYDDIFISSTASKYDFTVTETNKNVSVEFKWLTQPKNIVPVTDAILDCMIKHFGKDIYGKHLHGFTELTKGEQIYRSDANYWNQGYWNDNVIIAWESNKRTKRTNDTIDDTLINDKLTTTNVPGKLIAMFQIEDEEQLYCMIHSCYFQSHKQTVLLSMWMKEYQDVPESKFNQHKTMSLSSILVGTKPIYRVVEAESIVNHCLLIPYYASSCFYLLIKDATEWANEFHQIK